MIKEKRKELGLEAVSKVAVKIEGEKGGMMKDVHIKSADASYYEMHIDTDDANAFLLTNNDEVEILIGKEYE